MFNTFPQPKPDASGGMPSMLDWSAYQTVVDWTGTFIVVPPSTWGTKLSISGEGWLKFVQALFIDISLTIPDVRITIDGVPYIFSGVASTQSEIGNIINQPFYFKNSLKIEMFNASGSSAAIACDYTYLLKTGTPNASKQTMLLASQRKSAILINASTADVVNISGSGYLLGVEFSFYYGSGTVPAGDAGSGTITVDGSLKMNGRAVITPANPARKMHHFDGPIRFNSALRVQAGMGGVNFSMITRVFYTLD